MSARAMVAPVPPTLTKVVKKPLAVTKGKGSPRVVASTFAVKYWRKMGATIASMALSPLIPTDHSSVTRKAYIRMPGSVFRANTSGLKALWTISLISTSHDKANQPEKQNEKQHGAERKKRLVNDRRHIGRQFDDGIFVVEEFLNTD